MGQFQENWINNIDVRLHFLSNRDVDETMTPVVFVPGAFGSAELYQNEFKSLAPRPCFAMSLRGRGKSDAPQTGYTLHDHAQDIEAVISHLSQPKYVLVAFSMGVPYAVQFCLNTTQKPVGLIIVDYQASKDVI